MNNYVLVRPEHLNHHGHLFGGQMLSWIDDYCYIGVCRDYPNNDFVTKFMGQADFNYGIPVGSILRFHIEHKKIGTTSVTYSCEVSIVNDKNCHDYEKGQVVFSTEIVFVAVNANGKKTNIIK